MSSISSLEADEQVFGVSSEDSVSVPVPSSTMVSESEHVDDSRFLVSVKHGR